MYLLVNITQFDHKDKEKTSKQWFLICKNFSRIHNNLFPRHLRISRICNFSAQNPRFHRIIRKIQVLYYTYRYSVWYFSFLSVLEMFPPRFIIVFARPYKSFLYALYFSFPHVKRMFLVLKCMFPGLKHMFLAQKHKI